MVEDDARNGDPAVWLETLIRSTWTAGVEALRAKGRQVPKVVGPPRVSRESDRRTAAQSVKNSTTVKVYQAGEQTSVPMSWGSTDRDVRSPWTLDVQAGGEAARVLASATVDVIDAILALRRIRPHPDWSLIESWRHTWLEDYPDYQHAAFTLVLVRYGEVLPNAIEATT